MKRIITLFLVTALLVLPLSVTASATTVDSVEAPSSTVEPRLNKTITVNLGSSWTDIHDEINWLNADLLVENSVTSGYDLKVRIVSRDHMNIIASEKTVSSGETTTFYGLSSGGYIIQAKSFDDVQREYTLRVSD